jgi:hypothetical protein
MEPLIGAPPLPEGRRAVEAWHSLDRRTRADLLVGGRTSRDPTIAVIAVGYARTALARTPGRRIRIQVALVLAVTIVAAAVSLLLRPGRPVGGGWWLALYLVLGAALAWYNWAARRRRIRLTRMETGHASLLWQTEEPGPEDEWDEVPPAPPVSSLAVRFSWRARLMMLGLPALLVALGGWQLWRSGLTTVTGWPVAVTVAASAVLLYLQLRWVRPWAPVMRLDAAGLHIRAWDLRVPWDEVTEIRVTPVRGATARNAEKRVVAFMVTDPEALAGRISGAPARAARRSVQAYGTPLSISDLLMDSGAEDVVAAARTHTTAPVRRFA